jgi:flagellar hook-basal body complex protein FliE
VSANIYQLQTASHDFVANPREETWAALSMSLRLTDSGIDEWKQAATGYKQVEEAADEMKRILADYQTLADGVEAKIGDLKATEEQVEQSQTVLLTYLDKVIHDVVVPAQKAAVDLAAQSNPGQPPRPRFTILAACLGCFWL